MAITVEAVYEDGVLKPTQPLPFKDGERVRAVIEPASGTSRHAVIAWTGSVEDLDYLIGSVENDPLEGS